MEELVPNLADTICIGDFCTNMYHKVDQKHPVTGLFNGIRIVMFLEE